MVYICVSLCVWYVSGLEGVGTTAGGVWEGNAHTQTHKMRSIIGGASLALWRLLGHSGCL